MDVALFELNGLGLELLLFVFLAGIWAGMINTVVGSGTLVTFPVLVAMGVPPVSATVSNAIGLIAGNVTGAWGYRREIRQMKPVLKRLVPVSGVGGVVGAILLVTLPEELFGRVAPVLIVLSLVTVIMQPKLATWVRARRAGEPNGGESVGERETAKGDLSGVGLTLMALVFLTGIYGGYFVAAQGILLMGVLGVFLAGTLQHANGVKNLLVTVVNLTAAISYVFVDYLVRDPDSRLILWGVVLVIAAGSTIGGLAGAWVGRRLKPNVLRGFIVSLGLVALAVMVRDLVVD